MIRLLEFARGFLTLIFNLYNCDAIYGYVTPSAGIDDVRIPRCSCNSSALNMFKIWKQPIDFVAQFVSGR